MTALFPAGSRAGACSINNQMSGEASDQLVTKPPVADRFHHYFTRDSASHEIQAKQHGSLADILCCCVGAESGGVRPFGVSLLMAGYDDNGPQLYQIDPSGSYFAWKASAIGKNMTNAKTFLEKRYSEVGTLI